MLWRVKTLRLSFCVSGVGLLMLPILVAAVGVTVTAISQTGSVHLFEKWIIWGGLGVIIALAIAGLQTFAAYRKQTYDPTWVLKYQDKFDAMEEERKTAATLLSDQKEHLSEIKTKRKELSPIDDVLDLFEDIGFYVKGMQISPEAAHHHFYHWIRGYFQASRDYTDAWRNSEMARWEHLAYLFAITSEIERKRDSGSRQEDLDAFLREEIGEHDARD